LENETEHISSSLKRINLSKEVGIRGKRVPGEGVRQIRFPTSQTRTKGDGVFATEGKVCASPKTEKPRLRKGVQWGGWSPSGGRAACVKWGGRIFAGQETCPQKVGKRKTDYRTFYSENGDTLKKTDKVLADFRKKGGKTLLFYKQEDCFENNKH